MFEWDKKKNKVNFQKHGISFEEAVLIFTGPILTIEDKREDYGEKREISIGQIKNVIIVMVVHTKRGNKISFVFCEFFTRFKLINHFRLSQQPY